MTVGPTTKCQEEREEEEATFYYYRLIPTGTVGSLLEEIFNAEQ